MKRHYQGLVTRKLPDEWIRHYARGTHLILIGMSTHPSKSGTMRLVSRKARGLNHRGWDNHLWRVAKGLEIDLFFMGVKRLPLIINI